MSPEGAGTEELLSLLPVEAAFLEESLLPDVDEEEDDDAVVDVVWSVSGLMSGFESSPSNSKLMEERASCKMSSLAVVVVVADVVVASAAASLLVVMVTGCWGAAAATTTP